MVDATGTIVWQAAYLPYGQAQVHTEVVKNNLRFSGQYYDEESGLHYNLNRYYDPETGRYISADPIGLDGGMNLYAYVQNDPVNRVDPEGLVDNWYGHNDKDFKDWVHGQKQDEGRPGNQNYTKEEIKELHRQWKDEGMPRGKGGKSGKGGKFRGFKGARCVGILGLIGISLDAIEAQKLYEECKKDPCACSPDDCT